jgi:yeast amino acid transporter
MSDFQQSPQYYEEKKDGDSVEKGTTHDYVVHADERYHFDANDLDQVQRRLKQRHVQMIAVSPSSLLTGLFDSHCRPDRWYNRYWSLLGFW